MPSLHMNHLRIFFIQMSASILGTDFLGQDRSPTSELAKGLLLSLKCAQGTEAIAERYSTRLASARLCVRSPAWQKSMWSGRNQAFWSLASSSLMW